MRRKAWARNVFLFTVALCLALSAQQALAFAKSRQALAVGRADEILKVADECLAEIATFEATVQPLLGSDDGKKVAGDPIQLARFRAVADKDRPGKDAVERLRGAVETLIAPTRAAQANARDASKPGETIAEELDRIAALLATQKKAWAQDRRTVEAIVADAKRSARPAATQSLDQAVHADAEAEALALATATEKERARVRTETNAKLVKEAGELERKIEEAKLEKLRAAKQAEADRIKTDTGIVTQKGKDAVLDEKAKTERERLVKKANTEEVKQALAPFLTPGYAQPDSFQLLKRTVKKEPVSLGKLKAAGALEKTIAGLQNLVFVGSALSDDIRPRWKHGHYAPDWSSGQQEQFQKAQDLLNELGTVMVEEGLLAK